MGTANVGPQASKASSREEGMARLQANVSRSHHGTTACDQTSQTPLSLAHLLELSSTPSPFEYVRMPRGVRGVHVYATYSHTCLSKYTHLRYAHAHTYDLECTHRDPTKPPDLGLLGTRLASQRSGVGTAAVPFPVMYFFQRCVFSTRDCECGAGLQSYRTRKCLHTHTCTLANVACST